MAVYQQLSSLPEFSWTAWHGDGTLRAGLILLVGVYLLGVGPLRRRYRLGPPVARRQVAWFFAGVALLFTALEGPLHDLSDSYLFSAHMLQHMLLTLFAPPLLLLGTPGWLLQPLVRRPAVLRAARTVTRPPVALLLFNVPFLAYHLPIFYDRVARDHGLHVATHLLFIATAVITWWPVLSPLAELPRLPYPLQLLYVWGQTFSGFLVGVFVTKTHAVLYPFYSEAPRVWGLSPIDDQRLGGLLMWVGGGVYLLAVFSVIFFVWAYSENVDGDVVEHPLQPMRPARATGPAAKGGTLKSSATKAPVAERPAAEAPASLETLGPKHVAARPDAARRN